MSESPPRANTPLVATPPAAGLDTPQTPVDGAAAAPKPAPPRPGGSGSVPAPPRPRPSNERGERNSAPPPAPRPSAPPAPKAPPLGASAPAPTAAATPEAPVVAPVAASATPAAEAAAAPAAPRRRSRRAVKVEEDASISAEPASTDLAVVSSEGIVDVIAPEAVPAPPAPPAPPPLPPRAQVAPPPEVRPDFPPPPPVETADVIMPMRIIAIGDDSPPAVLKSEPPPPVEAAQAPPPPKKEASVPPNKAGASEVVEAGWTPRPAEVAAITAELATETANALPPPPPAPAAEAKPVDAPPAREKVASVEEVEVEVGEDDAAELLELEAQAARAEEVDDHLVEIEPEAPNKQQATAEAPKKPPPPPPPPKRAEAAAPAAQPAAPPPPPKAAKPPPSLPEPSRRRQRPWWEDLFDDDMIRTMDRVEPKTITRDVDFIESCLGLEKGATILDLACGTGQHAVELASRGYGVVGYDLSLNMLALAADEAQGRGQKLNFLQGDMREMAFDQVFDGLYCWSTSFGYFDDDKNFDVLRRMHRALRVDGILILDIINRDYVAPRQPSLVWFEGDGCVCMDEMQVDFFSSRLKVKRTAMFDDGRAREIDYSLRIYALHEIGKIMHDADFKVVEVTGHQAHPGVFFGSESPRLIIVAERK